MWHFLNKRLPLILVSEFPKSGGTWFCQMLSKTLDIPFPRNRAPRFEESILHSHFSYHNNFNDVIYIVRDGRDIMVSAFYYMLGLKENGNNKRALEYRKALGFKDMEDIHEKLPSFIEYFMENYTVLGKKTTWQDHVKNHIGIEKIHAVKYEDLLSDSAGQLQSTLDFLNRSSHKDLHQIAEEFTFENQSKRKAGQEKKNAFLRKGIAGDWKNTFSKEAAILFDQYAGNELIRLGYESDHSWVDHL